MTTFQDPQPQSRRAVRQSERSETTGSETTQSQPGFTESAAPATPQFYSDPTAPSEPWEHAPRRASQPAGPAVPISGRRAADPPAQPAPVAEPLTYSTQQRPVAPSFDAPTLRSRPSAVPELPPTQAIPQAEQPGYRVRDFSPEGRRAAPASEPGWNLTPPPASAPPASDLQYQTEGRVTPLPVSQVPPTPAPAPVASPLVAPATSADGEQTMSRREMRSMEQPVVPLAEPVVYSPQPAATQQVAPVPPAPVEQAPAFAAPEPVELAPAFAAPEPVELAPAFEAPEPVEPAPVEQTVAEPAMSAFDALFQPQAAESAPVQDVAPVQDSTPLLPLIAPEPEPNTGLTRALNEFDALTSVPEPATVQAPEVQAPEVQAPEVQPPAAQTAVHEPGTWTPPVGHWTTQAHQEDEFPESTVNRTIGSGSTATSALVIPIPLGNDIRGALTGTGEIILTGSIDLPHNLATTGQSDRFDHDGIDALFDLSDHEVVATDSAPVRAVTAVSTHSSGHGVTHTQKPKGTKALTALLIAASSMAVVVAGLLITAFALNIF